MRPDRQGKLTMLGLSALAVSYMAAWRLTDKRQRLRLDRLR